MAALAPMPQQLTVPTLHCQQDASRTGCAGRHRPDASCTLVNKQMNVQDPASTRPCTQGMPHGLESRPCAETCSRCNAATAVHPAHRWLVPNCEKYSGAMLLAYSSRCAASRAVFSAICNGSAKDNVSTHSRSCHEVVGHQTFATVMLCMLHNKHLTAQCCRQDVKHQAQCIKPVAMNEPCQCPIRVR